MFSFLNFNLYTGKKISVSCSDRSISLAAMTAFQRLLGCKLCSSNNPLEQEAHLSYISSNITIPSSFFLIGNKTNLYYSPIKHSFVKIRKNCLDKPPEECIPFYRWALDVAFFSAILRGERLAVVHGALLELPDGHGLLLHAESGVGKSTTCRRWETLGEKYVADDMILLEFNTSNGIIAHPLPTWSRCSLSMEGMCYPIEKNIPLAGVLVLSRAKNDEQEIIRNIPYPEYLCQIYQSCIYFHKLLIPTLPRSAQVQLISNFQACARKLCSMFPPRALMARLDGDLRETLKEFL